MSVSNQMDQRMRYLAQVRGDVNPAEPSLELLRNIIDEIGQENAQVLAERIDQVHRVLNQAIDRVEENDPRPIDAACVQNLQTQIKEAEEKSSTLKQILDENLATLKEREQQNIATTQKLQYFAALKQRTAPPSYGETRLCEVGSKLAAQAAKNFRENRNVSSRF